MSVAVSIDGGTGARESRDWVATAMARLASEAARPVEVPLMTLPLPEFEDISILIKDETSHPSGSLKHRLAYAMFAHAICSGDIVRGTPVIEASAGAVAISLAWFARLVDVPFVAVVPGWTSSARIAAIRWAGGEVIKAGNDDDCALVAFRIAGERRGHFMNHAARASEITDWRSDNIAEALFDQVIAQIGAPPDWVVAGAGTGATSATIGRHMRYRPELARTRLCVVDTEHSAYFKAFVSGDWASKGDASAVVEGIGRAWVEAAFTPEVVDKMIAVPDAASVAAVHWLEERTGRRFGPSTGTNIVGALLLAHSMRDRGRPGTVATIACDGGEAYDGTVYSRTWLEHRAIDVDPWRDLPRKIAALSLPACDDRDF